MTELIEFAARACLVSAGSIVGFHVLGPVLQWLLRRGRK
jgi:hypothetical protein